MINHFITGCWILLFVSSGHFAVFGGEVIKVPRGLDASLRCSSDKSPPPMWKWSTRRKDNIKTLVVNNTAYLLVENFQKEDSAQYSCVSGTENSTTKLEIQEGIKVVKPVYRIAVTGSLLLSCDALSKKKMEVFWKWGKISSERDCSGSGIHPSHFGHRAEEKNGTGNRFELSISPLLWSDSGHYQCILCGGGIFYREGTYEIITVKVYSDPAVLTEGGNGSLVCTVSHPKESTRFLWIHEQNQQIFRDPEESEPVEAFKLAVRNITRDQNAWVCAIFYQDRLRALIPFNLTVERRDSPFPEPAEEGGVTVPPGNDHTEAVPHIPTGFSQIQLTLVCLTGVVLLILGLGLTVYCHKRYRADEDTPHHAHDDADSVNYAELHFRKKKAAADPSKSVTCAMDKMTTEEDSVVYSSVVLVTGI